MTSLVFMFSVLHFFIICLYVCTASFRRASVRGSVVQDLLKTLIERLSQVKGKLCP
jgi:hypothetical protein